MLKIEHLYKSFGDTEVLKGIDLTVEDGSIVGLVGINGVGKSTLLRIIAGVYKADAGSVQLDGHDTWYEPQIREKIAYVSDEQYYPVGSTVGSLRLLYESMYAFDVQLYEKYLQVFGLDPKMSMASLSKGMRRRAALLYALCIHPRLILLDEAYDGLEPLARLNLKKILSAMVSDENVSVIIASHSLRELEDICDSFCMLEDGLALRHGDLAESKGMVHKYQIAYREPADKALFNGLDILHYEQEGRVVRLVVRGEAEEVTARLKESEPVLLDVLPVSFEELFLYELESRGYGNE